MLRFFIFAAIALQAHIAVEGLGRRFIFDVQDVICRNFTARVMRFDCEHVQTSPGNYLFSTRFMTNRPLGKNVDVRMRVQYYLGKGAKLVNLFDLSINLCDALSKIVNIPLIKTIVDELRRTSNFPYACPIKPNFLYKVENYTVTAKLLPPYAALANGSFTFELYEKKQILVSLTVLGGTVARL